MFRRFGAAVTVVERSARLLPREDEAVSAEILAILQNEGIVFRLGVECIRVRPHPEGNAVITDADKDELIGSHVLVAAGRVPNTDDLGLDKAGVETAPAGYIKVDARLATTVEGIWALGDCNGRGAFTHTAYNDAEIVAANLIDGARRSVDDRIPAYALYIDPPLGRAGLTVQQALAQGHTVRVGQRPMTRVGRAVEKGESQGSMRVVVDAQTDEILGAAILGPGGDEAVHMVLAAMAARMPAARLAQVMGIHPTVSELVPTIAGELSAPRGT
jgi:pyruvate/2-oxoglutarate dehydrogenase complex dihydrolipoamide dehydrogenase (E3) component